MYHREMELFNQLHAGLKSIPGVELYSLHSNYGNLPLLIVNVKGMTPEDVGAILDGDFNIAVRVGLHCAPLYIKPFVLLFAVQSG